MPSTPNLSTEPQPAATGGSGVAGWRWAPAWVLAYVALWPAPGIAEGVLVLGALLALFKLVGSRFRGGGQLLSNQAWALTSVLFCAYWVPELVSALDAVDRGRALKEAAGDLRYLPFLWLAAAAVGDARAACCSASASNGTTAPCGCSCSSSSPTPPCAQPATGRPTDSASITVRPNDSGLRDSCSTRSLAA